MILVGKLNLKKILIVFVLTISAVLADMNFNQSSLNQYNELRFLGWGKRKTVSECYINRAGENVKMYQEVYTVFWLKVGEPIHIEIPC